MISNSFKIFKKLKKYTINNKRMKNILLDIHNQCSLQPRDFDDAMVTVECVRELLKEVEDIYLKDAK